VFGLIQDDRHGIFQHRAAIAFHQSKNGQGPDFQTGQLGVHVATDLLRFAAVAPDDVDHSLIGAATLDKFNRRQPQPFLIYFCRAREIASRRAAADIDVVDDSGGDRDPATFGIDRFERDEIRQVLPA